MDTPNHTNKATQQIVEAKKLKMQRHRGNNKINQSIICGIVVCKILLSSDQCHNSNYIFSEIFILVRKCHTQCKNKGHDIIHGNFYEDDKSFIIHLMLNIHFLFSFQFYNPINIIIISPIDINKRFHVLKKSKILCTSTFIGMIFFFSLLQEILFTCLNAFFYQIYV